MPKTLGDLLTDTRSRLDEQASNFWSDTEVRRWIVEGARDLARRCEVLMAEDTITVTATVQGYNAPPDCIRIHRAEWRPVAQTTVYPLEYRDYNAMDGVW